MTQPVLQSFSQPGIQASSLLIKNTPNTQAISFANEVQKALSSIKPIAQGPTQSSLSGDAAAQNIRTQALIPSTITSSTGSASTSANHASQNKAAKKKNKHNR